MKILILMKRRGTHRALKLLTNTSTHGYKLNERIYKRAVSRSTRPLKIAKSQVLASLKQRKRNLLDLALALMLNWANEPYPLNTLSLLSYLITIGRNLQNTSR